MKRFIVLLYVFLSPLVAFSASPNLSSHNDLGYRNITKTDDVGVGFKWGTLSGLNVKYWSNETHAWDFTVAFLNGNTSVGVDYQWQFRNALAENLGIHNSDAFVPYLGIGLISAFGKDTDFFNRNTEDFALAVKAPLGIEYLPQSVSLGIFAELGLGFGFVPTNYTFTTANLGARYYF